MLRKEWVKNIDNAVVGINSRGKHLQKNMQLVDR